MLIVHGLGKVARRALLAVVVGTAVLVAAAGPALAVTPYPSTRAVEIPRSGYEFDVAPDTFGWSWMRSSTFSDVATWGFDNFDPSVLSYDHRMQIVLTPLVTNKASGGAGWTARVKVTVTYKYTNGSKTWTYSVTPINPFPFRSSVSSGGIGYQTFGKKSLSQSQFTHGTGSLKITVARDSAYSVYGFHPHVAVKAGAVSIWYLSR